MEGGQDGWDDAMIELPGVPFMYSIIYCTSPM